MIILSNSKGVPFTATEIAALNLNSPAGSYYQRVSVDFSSTPFIKCDGTKCESVPDGSFGAQVFCGQPYVTHGYIQAHTVTHVTNYSKCTLHIVTVIHGTSWCVSRSSRFMSPR